VFSSPLRLQTKAQLVKQPIHGLSSKQHLASVKADVQLRLPVRHGSHRQLPDHPRLAPTSVASYVCWAPSVACIVTRATRFPLAGLATGAA